MTLLILLILPLLSYVTYYYYKPNLHHHRHILITMMSFFYKKITPHSFLNLATTTTKTTTDNETLIPLGLLGLVTNNPASNDVTQRCYHPLVFESSSLKRSSNVSPQPSFLPPSSATIASAGSGSSSCSGDTGVFGFLDEVGKLDGFVSCTESLGFESSDEITRVFDDRIEQLPANKEEEMRKSENKRSEWRRMRDKRSSVLADKDHGHNNNSDKFPPMISSLNKNGQPNFYLRPVRKDGRLELTEVRIHRPEILRAHRKDGRLRLHLISHEDELDQENNDDQDDFDEDGNNNNVEEEGVKECTVKSGGDQWKMGGEGFRRCQDVAEISRHGGHHDIHRVWGQQHCVV